MKNNQLRGLIIAALILVVFNVLVFVCPFERSGVFWASYGFSMLSILLQIPAFYIAFSKGESAKSKLYGFPIARISIIYLVIQLVLGFVLMLIGSFVHVPAWIAVVPGVLLLAAAAVGFIAADAAREEIQRQEFKAACDISKLRKLQAKVSYLVTLSNNVDVTNAVIKLSESLRFSDPVSSAELAETEAELESRIDKLQCALSDNNDTAALDICAKAEAVLARRNQLCKLSKGNDLHHAQHANVNIRSDSNGNIQM